MADTRRALTALQALLADNSAGDISAQDVRDFLVSVDQANSVQIGLLANIPAADQLTGDLYYATDVAALYRWSGAAWVRTATGRVIQVVTTQTGAQSNSSTTIPTDDTIPQNTEGFEVMTRAITPTSATNKLRIDVIVMLSRNVANSFATAALFQDAGADAIAAMCSTGGPVSGATVVAFTHTMDAGTTSSTTFAVRVGGPSGTTTFNGAASARLFGGVLASSITITEYVP